MRLGCDEVASMVYLGGVWEGRVVGGRVYMNEGKQKNQGLSAQPNDAADAHKLRSSVLAQ